MDAWDLLLEHSTLATTGFDAWEHLNAQEGGGEVIPGLGGSIVLTDGLLLEMDMMEFTLDIDVPEYTIEIDNEFDIEVETVEFELEIE